MISVSGGLLEICQGCRGAQILTAYQKKRGYLYSSRLTGTELVFMYHSFDTFIS